MNEWVGFGAWVAAYGAAVTFPLTSFQYYLNPNCYRILYGIDPRIWSSSRCMD